jgi:hypothetical protein
MSAYMKRAVLLAQAEPPWKGSVARGVAAVADQYRKECAKD